jgi:tRNA nucleotidyltransferase (CCA-adding enzyme)
MRIFYTTIYIVQKLHRKGEKDDPFLMGASMEKSVAKKIPADALKVIELLESCGFEAWAVGGCVRDALLGKRPHDWDFCTSATPKQMRDCFAGHQIVAVGERHGTLAVRVEDAFYEVTTYRTDGAYLDARHPDTVQFVGDITQDLARRDFTINAMAWHPVRGLFDPFLGQTDLSAGVICCVGQPSARFREDALRVLRALRFSSVLGFSLQNDTKQAVLLEKEGLRQVARERIRQEVDGLLRGEEAPAVLREYLPVFAVFWPQLLAMQGFLQHSPYHDRDVLEHSLATLAAVPGEQRELRLAALLHDVAKPYCFALDAKGNGHFFGHAEQGAEIARQMLDGLRYDHDTAETVVALVRWHDIPLADSERLLRRRVARFGPTLYGQLLWLKQADAAAHAPAFAAERVEQVMCQRERLAALLKSTPCLTLGQLAVGGRDVLARGIAPGPVVGVLLNGLLNDVIDGHLPNNRDVLLRELERRIHVG